MYILILLEDDFRFFILNEKSQIGWFNLSQNRGTIRITEQEIIKYYNFVYFVCFLSNETLDIISVAGVVEQLCIHTLCIILLMCITILPQLRGIKKILD